MSSLWKRATPQQMRMMRAISGAVKNAADAHPDIVIPRSFGRSVAKRATGTLTAQWPDVLAAKAKLPSKKIDVRFYSRVGHLGACLAKPTDGDRLRLQRRSPLRALWKQFQRDMWAVKESANPDLIAAHVRVLQLLDEAAMTLEAAALKSLSREARKDG